MRFALLAFAALIASAFATSVPAACSSQPQSYMDTCGINSFSDCGDAPAFISVSFMFVTLLIALSYMYAKFRGDMQIEVWAKDEMFNLLISVFLFVGIIAFFSASCAISESYVGENPFDAAETYIDNLVQANGVNVLRTLTYDSINNQLDATAYYFQSMAPFSGSGSAFNANLKSRSAHKEFLIDLYLPILASLNAQKFLLEALRWIGMSILLPFAFVMRLVPPTREFGNVMIAVFFAVYIVVPFLYSMSGAAFQEIVDNPRCEYTDLNGNCNVHNFYSLGVDGGDATAAGRDSGLTMKNAMLYKIGSTIPQAIFLPNLVIIIAVTCVMSISKALRAIAA
ncbi:MAG: hypothetical protein WCT52_05640 [Candidatus Micrarchaeia archaeon]